MTHADDQGLLAMVAALPLVASSRPPYGPTARRHGGTAALRAALGIRRPWGSGGPACGPTALRPYGPAARRPGGPAARRPGGRKTARTPAAPAGTPYVYPSRFVEDFWAALPGPCE